MIIVSLLGLSIYQFCVIVLEILHFNDAYNIQETEKKDAVGGFTIKPGAARFVSALD